MMGSSEKRKHERLELRGPVQFRSLAASSKGKLCDGRYINLSARGVLIEAQKELPVSSEVEVFLNVQSPRGHGMIFEKPHRLLGRVCRINQTKKKKKVEMAIQFF